MSGVRETGAKTVLEGFDWGVGGWFNYFLSFNFFENRTP